MWLYYTENTSKNVKNTNFAYLNIYYIYYREKKIMGKDVTPYILARVNELTSGQSLQASILVIHMNITVMK